MTFHQQWSQLVERAELPSNDFLKATGPAPAHPSERRRFVRFRCRGPAVIERQCDRLGGYTVDVSRSGLGILSPVQLFPGERVEVVTPQQRLSVYVVWCVRLDMRCYHCGCAFQRSGCSD